MRDESTLPKIANNFLNVSIEIGIALKGWQNLKHFTCHPGKKKKKRQENLTQACYVKWRFQSCPLDFGSSPRMR